MAEEKVIVEIGAKDTASSVIEGVAKATEGMSNRMKSGFATAASASKTFAIGLAAAGTSIAAGLGIAVKAAANAEVAMARVNAILQTMGPAGEKAKTGILKVAAASVRLGFDDETAAESVAKLFQRTGDLTQATKLNALAMDLARAKNMDLATATQMVGLVLSGNGRLLKQYGIDIKESASPLEALASLQGMVGGQAEAFTHTFTGQMQVLKEQFTNFEEAIGAPFLGILTAGLTALNGWAVAMGGAEGIAKSLTDTFNTLRPYFGYIAAAITGALIPSLILAGSELLKLWNSFSIASSALLPWIALAAGAYWAYSTNFWGIRTDVIDPFVAYLQEVFPVINQTVMDHGGIIGTVKEAWSIVAQEVKGTIELMKLRYNTFFQDINNAIMSFNIAIFLAWKNTWTSIETWFVEKLTSIENFFSGWWERIVGWIDTILSKLGLVSSKAQKAAEDIKLGASANRIKGHQFGGVVEGARGFDRVPALLTAGEVVLNAAMQENIARNLSQKSSSPSISVIVTGNNFYGDDKQFAEKIGDLIVNGLTQHFAFPKY